MGKARRVWFTGDWHLHHTNIIKYCKRPFKTTEEMDCAILQNYKDTVGKNDTVYFLGDLAMDGRCTMAILPELVEHCGGNFTFIVGNHDRDKPKSLLAAPTLYEFGVNTKVGPQDVTLCHYPLESWHKTCHGSIHVHGHSHGRLREIPYRVDVGVDCWDYKPVSLKQVMESVRGRENGQL